MPDDPSKSQLAEIFQKLLSTDLSVADKDAVIDGLTLEDAKRAATEIIEASIRAQQFQSFDALARPTHAYSLMMFSIRNMIEKSVLALKGDARSHYIAWLGEVALSAVQQGDFYIARNVSDGLPLQPAQLIKAASQPHNDPLERSFIAAKNIERIKNMAAFKANNNSRNATFSYQQNRDFSDATLQNLKIDLAPGMIPADSTSISLDDYQIKYLGIQPDAKKGVTLPLPLEDLKTQVTLAGDDSVRKSALKEGAMYKLFDVMSATMMAHSSQEFTEKLQTEIQKKEAALGFLKARGASEKVIKESTNEIKRLYFVQLKFGEGISQNKTWEHAAKNAFYEVSRPTKNDRYRKSSDQILDFLVDKMPFENKNQFIIHVQRAIKQLEEKTSPFDSRRKSGLAEATKQVAEIEGTHQALLQLLNRVGSESSHPDEIKQMKESLEAKNKALEAVYSLFGEADKLNAMRAILRSIMENNDEGVSLNQMVFGALRDLQNHALNDQYVSELPATKKAKEFEAAASEKGETYFNQIVWASLQNKMKVDQHVPSAASADLLRVAQQNPVNEAVTQALRTMARAEKPNFFQKLYAWFRSEPRDYDTKVKALLNQEKVAMRNAPEAVDVSLAAAGVVPIPKQSEAVSPEAAAKFDALKARVSQQALPVEKVIAPPAASTALSHEASRADGATVSIGQRSERGSAFH